MRILSTCFAGAFAGLFVACTEPRQADVAKPAPSTPFAARVELSDSSAATGAVVTVTLRLAGPTVAAATVRLSYDSTGLAFAGEQTLDDGVTRVANPTPGLVRVAALAPAGMKDGRVHALRFTVLRTASLRSLKLTVDEAHTAAGTDAAHTRTP